MADPKLSNLELADFIDGFLTNLDDQGPYEWDDFTIFKSKHENIERVRQRVIAIATKYPDTSKQKMWCSKEGSQELSKLAEQLRSGKFEENGTE